LAANAAAKAASFSDAPPSLASWRAVCRSSLRASVPCSPYRASRNVTDALFSSGGYLTQPKRWKASRKLSTSAPKYMNDDPLIGAARAPSPFSKGSRTHDGRKYRMLNVLDEFTHECLAIRVARKLKAIDVIGILSDLFILHGIPAHIRSDNGPDSWPRPCRNGSQLSAPRALISSGAVLGRTVTSRASTRAFATSCSTAKSSTRSERPESSSRAGSDQAARLNRIQATSTGGVRPCLRRVAGCATTSGSAGHAGATANIKLTFHLDHSAGADHLDHRIY
jgi:hypothetical protein